MIELGYNLINTIATYIPKEANILTPTPVVPRQIYKIYVRIAEAITIFEKDILFTLELYEQENHASSWHNFNVYTISFISKIIEILQETSKLIFAINSQKPDTDEHIELICFTGCDRLIELLERNNTYVLYQLDKNNCKRIFTDYNTEASKIMLEHIIFRFGMIEGLEHFSINFNQKEEFSKYYNRIKAKPPQLYDYLNLLRVFLTEHYETNELLGG